MPPEIRPAQPCDLAAVLDIAKESFTLPADRFGAKWLVRRLALPGVELYVDSPGAGVVRGFVMLERYPTGTVVRLIATGSQHRGQGVAKRLLAATVPTGPGSTWIRTENQASRATFESAGWKISTPPRARSSEWVYYALPDARESP